MKLKKIFYSRRTEVVARDLIGKVLCRKTKSGLILKCVITETEAYLGLKDKACHTFGGRRTPRTEVMWGESGRAYVYFIYGMYFCLNAVTREVGIPEAVLIRGAIPLLSGKNKSIWSKKESEETKWNKLMSGPGKLCRVLDIDKSLNGASLQSQDLWIEDGLLIPSKEIVKSARIGIDYTKDDPAGSHQWPLRFLWKSAFKLLQSKGDQDENIFRHYKNHRQNSFGKNAKNRRATSG